MTVWDVQGFRKLLFSRCIYIYLNNMYPPHPPHRKSLRETNLYNCGTLYSLKQIVSAKKGWFHTSPYTRRTNVMYPSCVLPDYSRFKYDRKNNNCLGQYIGNIFYII